MFSSPDNHENYRDFESWVKSGAGEFAVEQKRALVEQLIAGWPRRGRNILEVGCGVGYLLETFWEAGLDISGLDAVQEHLDKARQSLGDRADLMLGQPDHLPFDQEEFDYVAVLNPLSFAAEPEPILREAFRVARKGVIFGFFNKYSLHRLSCACRRETCPFHVLQWYSCVRMLGLVRRISGGLRGSIRSTLFGPPATWDKDGLWKRINGGILPTPFGAYVALRVDLERRPGVKPLYLTARASVGAE